MSKGLCGLLIDVSSSKTDYSNIHHYMFTNLLHAFRKDSTTYSIRRVIMMATCAIMYIVATVHWGILLNWWVMAARTQIKSFAKNIEDLSGNNGAATVCSLVGNHLGNGVIESHNLRAFNPPTCAPSVLLSVNVSHVQTLGSSCFLTLSELYAFIDYIKRRHCAF